MSNSRREHDLRQLAALLEMTELREDEREAFKDMRASLLEGGFHQLTEKQRNWVKSRHEELVPQYENLISSGKAPRGREVELMVKDKPLRPPLRKVED